MTCHAKGADENVTTGLTILVAVATIMVLAAIAVAALRRRDVAA
jgi:hypothetical protein